MNAILNYIEKNIDPLDTSNFPRGQGLIMIKDKRLLGICLKDSILLFNALKSFSFRLKYININNIGKIKLIKYQTDIDFEMLENYFIENQDNPYAAYYIFEKLLRNILNNQPNQFPPLFFSKTKEEYNSSLLKLHTQAEVGDVFFTYDRTSGLARLIRNSDYSMWSHTGIIGKNKNFFEMTSEGNSDKREILSLINQPNIDIALYRVPDFNKNGFQSHLDGITNGEFKYDWVSALKIYLNYKLGKDYFKNLSTVRELYHSYPLKLIAYA